jgi:iron complex transport system substrate-binding protein
VARTIAAALLSAAIFAGGSWCAGATAPRIVSLAPAVTETIFALGAGSELVGVSDYCDYPPAARKLPRVGSFLTPNVEQIIALTPSLIIGADISSNQREIAALDAMGYRTATVADNSIAEIEDGIERVGTLTGREQAAQRLAATVSRQVTATRSRVAGLRPRRVLMVVGHQPMVAVGPGSYLDQLIRLAGGINIAAGAAESWPRLSIEYIIAMKPQVILDGQMGSDQASMPDFWRSYPTIPAVRDDRVYGYPQDPTLHPGPRIAESLAIIAARIHPEVFAPQAALKPAMAPR